MIQQPPEGLTLSLIQKVMASLAEPEVIFYIEWEYVPDRFAYYVIPREDDSAKSDIICHPTMVAHLGRLLWPMIPKRLDYEERERRFQAILAMRIAAMGKAI